MQLWWNESGCQKLVQLHACVLLASVHVRERVWTPSLKCIFSSSSLDCIFYQTPFILIYFILRKLHIVKCRIWILLKHWILHKSSLFLSKSYNSPDAHPTATLIIPTRIKDKEHCRARFHLLIRFFLFVHGHRYSSSSICLCYTGLGGVGLERK